MAIADPNVVSMFDFDSVDESIEVQIGKLIGSKRVIWINVDGVCRLRAYCDDSKIHIIDERGS